MAGGGMGAAAPTSTGQGPAQGGIPIGGMGFGLGASGFADYNPAATGDGSGLFSGGTPAPGQMNWQLTDAQRSNLLAQQQARDAVQAPVQQAPVGAPPPAQAEPTGLQFGTAGVGTGIVEAQAPTPTPQAAPQTMAPFQQQMMMRQQQQYNPYQQQMAMRQQQQYNPYQQQMMRQNPYQQQMAQQNPYQQQQFGGLQAALAQLISRYNQPMQRQQFMPSYQNQALQYRPDLSQAQASLGRTATTKAEAQAAAEKAALAKLGLGESGDEDAGFRAWQRQHSLYNSGGGG